MPYLAIYAFGSDFDIVLDWLNGDKEIAFIVSRGGKRWIATDRLDAFERKRYMLWHIPGGRLPLLHAGHIEEAPTEWIENPWKGWKERRTGVDSSIPFFGSPPHVFSLEVGLNSIDDDAHSIGFTGFGWIGNRYRILGSPAHPLTEKWWRRLRQRVKKTAVLVPRGGSDGGLLDTRAFPTAYQMIRQGIEGDRWWEPA
jgi:hypothetical protein